MCVCVSMRRKRSRYVRAGPGTFSVRWDAEGTTPPLAIGRRYGHPTHTTDLFYLYIHIHVHIHIHIEFYEYRRNGQRGPLVAPGCAVDSRDGFGRDP
jgi:hypothetical protein